MNGLEIRSHRNGGVMGLLAAVNFFKHCADLPWNAFSTGLTSFYTMKLFRKYLKAHRNSELLIKFDELFESFKLQNEVENSWLPLYHVDYWKHEWKFSFSNKAPYVFRMIEDMIGEKKFRQIIQEFVRRYSFDVATLRDFTSKVTTKLLEYCCTCNSLK